MKKVLIIDDDRVLRSALAAALAAEGYGVAEARDGREGLDKALKGGYDLVVIDVVMPSLTGFDVVRKLREAGRQIPLIVTSGKKKKEVDKVLGLELGGDDYLTKPFGMAEFIARVHAVLRRSRPETVEIDDVAFGDVAVDFRSKTAVKGGRELRLTAMELSLLRLLAAHAGQAVSRQAILEKVWGFEKFPTTRTIDTFMYNLRRKIEDEPSAPKHLLTVPRLGYKFQR
ncbi:MAG TPA: response regulator transcription factor [Candidatus Aminicenantes bacterium]|nr:response regulator transcription factor [Candidatus Aminicenantes bacterium]